MRRMYSESELRKFIQEHGVDVVASLLGKDISVEGITSKGIANTGGLANIGDVAISGDLIVQGEGKGNISASGKITGGEIVENMSGYSFNPQTKANITITPIFVSAAKNGNKLSQVYFGKLNRSGDVSNDFITLGYFRVPKNVGSKIVPTPISGQNGAINSKTIQAFSAANTKVDLNCLVIKQEYDDYDSISIYIYNMSSLTLSTDYQIRLEMTYLLGENFVSQE